MKAYILHDGCVSIMGVSEQFMPLTKIPLALQRLTDSQQFIQTL